MATKIPIVVGSNGEYQQLQAADTISTGNIAGNTIMGNNTGSSGPQLALTKAQVALLTNAFAFEFMGTINRLNSQFPSS